MWTYAVGYGVANPETRKQVAAAKPEACKTFDKISSYSDHRTHLNSIALSTQEPKLLLTTTIKLFLEIQFSIITLQSYWSI